MDKILSQLIRISNTVGRDSSFVQGGGGNTSVKTRDGKYMYVKASGTALKDMNAKQGWRRLKLQPVLTIIGDDSLSRMKTSARQQSVTRRLLLACDGNVKGGTSPIVEA